MSNPLTAALAARELGLDSPAPIYKAIASGELKASRVASSHWKIDPDSFAAFKVSLKRMKDERRLEAERSRVASAANRAAVKAEAERIKLEVACALVDVVEKLNAFNAVVSAMSTEPQREAR